MFRSLFRHTGVVGEGLDSVPTNSRGKERAKVNSLLSSTLFSFQLWLDSCAAPPVSPPPKEEDFFAAHASQEVSLLLCS